MQAQANLDPLPLTRRPKHVPQISINDDYHPTEVIGSYYDEEQSPTQPKRPATAASPPSNPRPYSFMPSPNEIYESRGSKRGGGYFEVKNTKVTSPSRPAGLERTRSNEQAASAAAAETGRLSPKSVRRMASLDAQSSGSSNSSPAGPTSPPTLSRQSSTDTAIQQFPLTDIDYESSPAAVAQELSNLQAIRRMSMNVDTGDPDLAGFGGVVPTVAPKRTEANENDASQLFWVPARLHPELAPKEFKTFIEDRVEKIRRKSADNDSLSVDSLERSGSGSGSLRRKKSMLSHQIDTKGEYEDGAERLERKRSSKLHVEGQTTVANLADLESLVNDPEQLRRRLSLDTVRRSLDSGVEVPPTEDMPILPPGGQTLKRSTRTTYRRGSLKRGERMPPSKRAQQRQSESSDADDIAAQPPMAAALDDREPILGLTRVQTEPTPSPSSSDNLDTYTPTPRTSSRRRAGLGTSQSTEQLVATEPERPPVERRRSPPPRPSIDEDEQQQPQQARQAPQPRPFHSRLASGGRTTAQLPGYNNTNPLPQVIETLPDGTKIPVGPLAQQFPERKQSYELSRPANRPGNYGRPSGRPSTLDDLSGNPSPLPGHGATRTDALTMVPTFEDHRPERKDSTKKSGWKWLIGNDEEEKEREKKAAREERALDGGLSAGKSRSGKLSKSPTEKARLDVLQNSIDGTVPPRGRESLVLNRAEIQLEDERRKESKRAADGSKKEKDSGLLSAIFGGKKKTSDSDLKDKKRKSDRAHSPIPVPRILRPDIDYNWTRFSILEERAIYRMAHMKLANPRRALYSQVLLSNFMYSYLAKVQQMHPQMQIPAAQQHHQQQQQQKAAQQRKQEQQPAEYSQYQRWQEQQSHQETQNAMNDGRTSSEIATGSGGRASYDMDDQQYQQQYATGDYDRRRSSEEYDQSHQHQYGHHQYSRDQHPNGNYSGGYGAGPPGQSSGYNVANNHDYLGYAKDEQPFDHGGGDGGLWDDKAEELW